MPGIILDKNIDDFINDLKNEKNHLASRAAREMLMHWLDLDPPDLTPQQRARIEAELEKV